MTASNCSGLRTTTRNTHVIHVIPVPHTTQRGTT